MPVATCIYDIESLNKITMNISNIIVNLTTITYVYITAIIEELLVLKIDILYFKIKY